MRHGVPGPQDVEPLPPRSRPHEEPRERPQAAQKGAEHEMGGVDEKHVTDAGLSLVQTRFQLLIVECGLGGGVLRQVFLGGTGIARTRWHRIPMPFRNFRTCVGPRRIPVSS